MLQKSVTPFQITLHSGCFSYCLPKCARWILCQPCGKYHLMSRPWVFSLPNYINSDLKYKFQLARQAFTHPMFDSFRSMSSLFSSTIKCQHIYDTKVITLASVFYKKRVNLRAFFYLCPVEFQRIFQLKTLINLETR